MPRFYKVILLVFLVYFANFSIAVCLPPTVSITSEVPASGVGWAPLNVTVNYTLTGAATVSFYVDGSIVSQDQSRPGNWQWTTPALNGGTHNLQISAPGNSVSVNYSVILGTWPKTRVCEGEGGSRGLYRWSP